MAKPEIGQIRKTDFQADIFEGEYEIVADLGDGTWEIRYLEPSDEVLDRIESIYRSGGFYLGYVDPFGPGRRELDRNDPADVEFAMMREIEERIERAGSTSRIRFVSAAEHARHF